MPRRMPERLLTIGYNARVLDGINGMNEIGAYRKDRAEFSNQGFPAKARRREGVLESLVRGISPEFLTSLVASYLS